VDEQHGARVPAVPAVTFARGVAAFDSQDEAGDVEKLCFGGAKEEARNSHLWAEEPMPVVMTPEERQDKAGWQTCPFTIVGIHGAIECMLRLATQKRRCLSLQDNGVSLEEAVAGQQSSFSRSRSISSLGIPVYLQVLCVVTSRRFRMWPRVLSMP